MVIALTNQSDAHHRAAVNEIERRRRARQAFKLSAVSVAELHSIKGPGRKARIELTDRFVEALGVGAILGIDRQTAELAGEARANRPSLHLADALIKASADRIGGELLTTDRRLSRLDGVKLIPVTPR